MLIDKRCPHCGATMQFEDTMDSMFCPFCGGMVENDFEDYRDNPRSNDPNLYISYNSTDPAVGMVTRIVSTGVKNTYINGQTLSFHLAQGAQTIVLKIGRRNYNRNIVIPTDNSPVRIYASYNGRAHIAIDQPNITETYSNSSVDDSDDGYEEDQTNEFAESMKSFGTEMAGIFKDTANTVASGFKEGFSNASANNTVNSPVNQPIVSSPATTVQFTGKHVLIFIIGFAIFATMFFGCVMGLGSSDDHSSSSEVTTTTTVKTYDVTLNVKCDQNLIFSKYDVDVEIDGKAIGKIEHGETKTLNCSLTEGTHTVTFRESGSTSVEGSTEIVVAGATAVNCRIRCTSSKVEIKEFEPNIVETDPLSGKQVTERQQRNGFDSSTNKKIGLANYVFEIPEYWAEDETQKKDTDSYQKHVSKTEADDTFVRLLYIANDDPDNSMFKRILVSKESYTKGIAEGIGASKYTLIRQELVPYGDVNGMLTVLEAAIEKSGVVYNVRLTTYIFPSTEKQKYLELGLIVSDNAKYEYTDDFISVLKTIKKNDGSFAESSVETSESSSTSSSETSISETTTSTPTPTPTPVPTSTPTPTPETEKKSSTRFAYSKSGPEYTIYYIIDTKAKKVYYFTSMDRKPTVGTIKSGSLSTGITVKYYDGTEKIAYAGDESTIVVHDSFGNDWYFDSCSLKEAEGIIKK